MWDVLNAVIFGSLPIPKNLNALKWTFCRMLLETRAENARFIDRYSDVDMNTITCY